MVVATKTVASHPLYYWGEGGQYGPFDIQTDGEWAGWPDFGQVMRYFRKRVRPKLSAKAFGVLYGKAANNGSSIGERWILEMELENKVPADMSKRKAIAQLLQIPPMLFGLAVLEEMKLDPHPQRPIATGQTKLIRVPIDIGLYQNNVRTIWQLHDTGNAHSALGLLESDIRALARFEQQTKGDLCYHVQEILFGYQLLATHIVRDQRRFSSSYYHANEAVRVAKAMQDCDLIATALFTRGWTNMEWGLYGRTQQGIFQVQQNKLEAAIRDFEEAKKVFPTQNGKENMHPQLLGRLMTYKSRAQAALAVSKKRRVPASVLMMPDDAAELIGQQEIDDLYTRTLVTGTRSGFHEQAYLSNRSSIFAAANLPMQALQEINASEHLTEKIYRRDETRQFTWLDILKANIYMQFEEFGTATDYARRAALACQDINSVTNITIINDIYGRLLQSSYKTSKAVHELGDILEKSRTSITKPEA